AVQHRSRRGIVAALGIVCLVAVIGMVVIAVDGGVLFDERRQVQLAADAAALAGAVDLFTNSKTNDGKDPKGTAQTSALTTAAANGFTTNNSTITVNIPPQSGPFTGQA